MPAPMLANPELFEITSKLLFVSLKPNRKSFHSVMVLLVLLVCSEKTALLTKSFFWNQVATEPQVQGSLAAKNWQTFMCSTNPGQRLTIAQKKNSLGSLWTFFL
eukprot:TRINITY_DN11116_c0_g1_i1.p1 TRINITY_DN11116_c0_g1~~TRINITY_DN11116_c0_g1_i1.p1  ORF type:complete len:104 (+),score=9.22 TRINITY_DN11116_c0_g1_i1:93-404(+)